MGQLGTSSPNVEQLVSTWLEPATVSGRIRSLEIDCDEEEFGTIAPYLQHPMVNLATLTIQLDLADDTDVLRLPRDICPGADSHLSKLTLLDCIPRWDSPLLSSSLTHLSVRRVHDIDPEFVPTREQFANVLSSLTSLQYLSLHDVFPHLPPPGAPDILIKLPPCLKHADFETNRIHERCMRLIPSLSFSPSTCVETKITDIGWDEPELAELLVPMLDPAITALHHSRSDRVGFVELVIQLRGLGFYASERPRASWSTRIPSRADTLSPEQRQGTVFFSTVPVPEMDRGWEFRLCRRFLSLPLHDVRAISLARRAIEDMKGANVLSDLIRAQAVRRLGIDMLDSASLLNLLGERLPDGAFRIFPLLKILHIHVGYLGRNEELDQAKFISDALALVDLVASRRDGGAPLQEIVVEQAFAYWDVWDVLRSDVPVNLFDF